MRKKNKSKLNKINKYNIRRKPLIIVITIVTILAIIIGVSYARYVSQVNSDKKVVSPYEFYFTSNYLTEESDKKYTISNYDPGEEIIVDIYNYEDELRYTEGEIIYNVTAEGTNNDNIQKGEFTGADLKISQIKITLDKDDFINGKATFKLTANSTSPYIKVISATFDVYESGLPEDAYMEVVDSLNSYVVATTVVTEGLDGVITLNFPSTLVPDMGDDRITEVGDSYMKFNADKNSIYEFTLFKENLDDVYAIDPSNRFQIITEVAGTERLPIDAMIGYCDDETVRNEESWGQYDRVTVENGETPNLTYVTDENGNIGFEGKVGSAVTAKIPVEEPVNEFYSLTATIKVDITKNVLDKDLGGTVVAISPVWGQQIAWIAVKANKLEIYSYQYYSPFLNQGDGYISVDITEYNNQYINIILTGENGGKSNLYINGEFVREFNSGRLEFQNEPELTIGDLRPNRGLYFIGTIYNFVLYNRVVEDYEVRSIWNFYQEKLGITE